MKHSNKCFMITGGSRGIGAGIAKYLAGEGARVAITFSTNEEAAKEVLNNCDGEGHLSLKMDTSNDDSVSEAISTVLKEFGHLDGLVNNAGITRDQILLRMKVEEFDQVIQTNLRGTFLCTKAVMKPMLKKKSGSIVNISSVIGHTGNPGQSNYAASKAGIEAFTKSAALEVASRNIRLNCVAPGFISTEMTGALSEDQITKIAGDVPLNRLGDVKDIAASVSFLLSEESGYITGQTIHVNGGLFM